MPPNPSPPLEKETTEREFVFKLKGSRHLGSEKDKEEQQQMVKHCATMLQDMAELFETIANDCKHATGSGGCKLSADGCTGIGCPMGGE